MSQPPPVRAASPPRLASGAAAARRESLGSVSGNRANAEERCPNILDKNVFKKRFDEVQKFLKNGLYYQSVNNAPGALVSYSNAETYVHFMIQLFEHAKTQTDDVTENGVIDQYIGFLKKLEQQLLGYIEVLQEKTKNLVKSGGGGGKKEDKEEWQEVCQTVIPRIFSGEALTFADVIGLYREKELIRTSFIKPLLLPNLFPALSKGILLFGPPGTGKTYLAKAAITELQGIDPSIGVIFFDPTGADLKGKYVGETEKRITKYFTCAARAACAAQEQSGKANKPKKYISILFIDEFDNVAGDRMSDETGLMANSVNTILQMMDGVQSFKNVAVMAATNYPWKLDAAVLRRFTNQIMINVPSSADILDLLKYEFKKNIKIKSFNYFCYCKDEINDSVYKSGPALDALCPLTFSVKNNVKHTADDVTFSFPLKKGDTVLGVTYNQLEDEKTGNTKLFIVVNYRDVIGKVYTERYEFNVKGRLSSPEIITSVEGTTSPYVAITEEELTEDATRISTDMQILKGYLQDKMPIEISKAASLVIEKLIAIKAKEKELREAKGLTEAATQATKKALQAQIDQIKVQEVTARTELKRKVGDASVPIDRRNLRDKHLKDLQYIGKRFQIYREEPINFNAEYTRALEVAEELQTSNTGVDDTDQLTEDIVFHEIYTAKLGILQYEITGLYNKVYSEFVNIKDYNSLTSANTKSGAVNLQPVIDALTKLFPFAPEGNAARRAKIDYATFQQKQIVINSYEKILYSLILKNFILLIFTYASKIKLPIQVFKELHHPLQPGDGWGDNNHGWGDNNDEGGNSPGGGAAAGAAEEIAAEAAAAAKAKAKANKEAANAEKKLNINLGTGESQAITVGVFNRLLKSLQRLDKKISAEQIEEILKDTRLSKESDWIATLDDQSLKQDILAFKQYLFTFIDELIAKFSTFKTAFNQQKTIETFMRCLKWLSGVVTMYSDDPFTGDFKTSVDTIDKELEETNKSKLASLFITYPSIITGNKDDDDFEEARGGAADAGGGAAEAGGGAFDAAGAAAAAGEGLRRRFAGGGYRRQTPRNKKMRRQTKRLSR